MKFITAIITLFVACAALSAQSVQKGRVLLYNGTEAKTALQGVTLSASGAGATISDAEGLFTLSFRTLHAGDAIRFRRIELSGYEVMNQEALDNVLIANQAVVDDEASLLTIVMCSTEELARLRDGYRTVAAQRYEQQLADAQRQVEQLQADGKIKAEEYAKRMDELETRYEQQLETLDTYVDKFARIDLSELDDFEKEIIALVQQGEFDEAIARYDDQHLTERLQKGVEEQRKLASDVETVSKAITAKEAEAERLERNIEKRDALRARLKEGATE